MSGDCDSTTQITKAKAAKVESMKQIKAAYKQATKEGKVMKYQCKLIKKTDDCPAAKYVEDDEDLFIFDEDENFYLADEFFNMKGEMKFEVVE